MTNDLITRVISGARAAVASGQRGPARARIYAPKTAPAPTPRGAPGPTEAGAEGGAGSAFALYCCGLNMQVRCESLRLVVISVTHLPSR